MLMNHQNGNLRNWIGFCRLPKTWFLQATHAGTTDKYTRKAICLNYWAIFHQSQKKHSLTSCEIKSQRNTDSKHKENRKTVTWLESGFLRSFWCSRVTTHSTLSRAMHDSAKMVTVSAPNFGNNLLGQKETVWKQFVIIQPSFLFPLTKVILTIDLSSAWMAFPSVLGCQWCSQTELFNSVRQCCFRPHLWGKAFKLLLYAHSSNTLTQ